MILAFIKDIEKAISASAIVLSSTVQKHFSSAKKEAYLRGNLLFIDMSSFEFAVYITARGRKAVLEVSKYHSIKVSKIQGCKAL